MHQLQKVMWTSDVFDLCRYRLMNKTRRVKSDIEQSGSIALKDFSVHRGHLFGRVDGHEQTPDDYIQLFL